MAAQSALFYRCLGSWAEDVELRRVAHEMALEDQAAFGRFQVAYAEAARTERLGVYGAWRTATECMRDARDHYVRGAFEAVSDAWGPNSPFGVVSYDDFVRRTRALVGEKRGAGIGLAARHTSCVPRDGCPKANVAARLEWQRYDSVGGDNTGKDDVDLFSLGLVYRF